MHTELKKYRFTGCDEWFRRDYFTAGMGEFFLYQNVCTDMDYFGMELDEAKNEDKDPKNMRNTYTNTKT
jgi:acetate kinase